MDSLALAACLSVAPLLEVPDRTCASHLSTAAKAMAAMADVDLLTGEEEAPPSMIALTKAQLERKFNHVLDKTKPHILYRWLFLGLQGFIYFLRVYFAAGWYIVTYALGIYILNLFIGFLTPQSREAQEEEAEGGLKLPTRDDEEYRPFERRVPEFVFWWGCAKAFAIAFTMTLFRVFDIPVFWPILVIYFIVLFVITMKRQIQDMLKHGYLPWSKPKKKYMGGDIPGKSASSSK